MCAAYSWRDGWICRPFFVVCLNLNAYMMDLPMNGITGRWVSVIWWVSICYKTVYLIRAILFCNQLTDSVLRRPICSILPVTTFSQFMLIVNYLRLTVDTSFLHLKLSSLIRLRISWICHWRWKIRATTYSKFTLIINHLQLKVDAGFSHLQYISIEYHPIATEGGGYGKNHSIHFLPTGLKKHKTPRILRWARFRITIKSMCLY